VRQLEELCETMLQGSLCGLGGMTPFPVSSALKHFREDFRARTQH
jgi:formate dehydrogenase iron-sulfur subunit